jgi:hypothetical protein
VVRRIWDVGEIFSLLYAREQTNSHVDLTIIFWLVHNILQLFFCHHGALSTNFFPPLI